MNNNYLKFILECCPDGKLHVWRNHNIKIATYKKLISARIDYPDTVEEYYKIKRTCQRCGQTQIT
jgi:hypothetical protein